MSGFTPKLPLNLGSEQGYVLIKDIKQLAIQNFLMILLTNPGERIMDSSFGVGIKKILFENFNSFSTLAFEENLQNQVKKYAPYIRVDNINYGETDQDLGLLNVVLTITIIPLAENVVIKIDKNGSLVTNFDTNF